MEFKKVFLWLSVLPVTIFGVIIGQAVVNIFSYINVILIGGTADGLMYKSAYWVVSAIFGGALSLYLGVKIAPSYKKIVAIVLSFLLVSFYVYNLLYFLNTDRFFWPILGFIGSGFGTGYVLFKFFNDENLDLFKE